MYISKRVIIAGVLLAVVLAGTTWAFAQEADEIVACVNPRGLFRIVTHADECNESEYAISWNKQGPQGPEGPQGPQGPQGEQGPPGYFEFYVRSGKKLALPQGGHHVRVLCDTGDRATGGGYRLMSGIPNNPDAIVVIDNPYSEYIDGAMRATGWDVAIYNRGTAPVDLYAEVVCLDVTP
jgi:hypothetical protein